ncbi:hypothetical protein [Prochlorococcus sp. MIT 1300]|uniref:hypothetical protein n=1 Tax=Prochlorococcus sp. MIT 1300 TaxID=3096218 RepID=UPI002A754887|nr:hypothetical protein [Prochlorococcus sp. MIT 1300]
MNLFFSVALALSPLEVTVIVISGMSFLVMFGIASAKGGFQDLVKTTLANDESRRNRDKK